MSEWMSLSHVRLFETPWTSPWTPWTSPGENTGVGSLSLLLGIAPTQGSNPGLLHCRRILYQTSHKGSPRILEWVAYSFSRRSSQPRNQTRVSRIAGRFFTNWAIREAQTIKWSKGMISKIQNEYFCAGGGQTRSFKDIGDVHVLLKPGGGYRRAHLLLFLISYT